MRSGQAATRIHTEGGGGTREKGGGEGGGGGSSHCPSISIIVSLRLFYHKSWGKLVKKIILDLARQWWLTPLIAALKRQRQLDL